MSSTSFEIFVPAEKYTEAVSTILVHGGTLEVHTSRRTLRDKGRRRNINVIVLTVEVPDDQKDNFLVAVEFLKLLKRYSEESAEYM